MTTTIGTDPGTASERAHDAAVKSELITLTDALLAAVGARETHELAQRAHMPVLRDEILPQVAVEQIVFGDTPAAPRADLPGAAMAVEERRLIGLVAEMDHAATGIEAVRAADAVVALLMIGAEEMTVPVLAACGDDREVALCDAPDPGDVEADASVGVAAPTGHPHVVDLHAIGYAPRRSPPTSLCSPRSTSPAWASSGAPRPGRDEPWPRLTRGQAARAGPQAAPHGLQAPPPREDAWTKGLEPNPHRRDGGSVSGAALTDA